MRNHEHIWIGGPELPRVYGSCFSRICTECGIYELLTWYGEHLNYDWYVDADEQWLEKYENR